MLWFAYWDSDKHQDLPRAHTGQLSFARLKPADQASRLPKHLLEPEPQAANLGADNVASLQLQQIGGCLPTTFESCHTGRTTTWTSNATGAEARCDYLIMPLDWGCGKVSTYPQTYVDAGNSGTDHTPLAGDFSVMLEIRKLWKKGALTS